MKVEVFMQVIASADSPGPAGKFDRKKALKDNHYVKRFTGPDAKSKATKFYNDLRDAVRATGI
jgi:hypothetical protein